MILANLSIPLLGFVDAAMLGHLDRSVYLAAASLGAQIIALLFWSFGFLRMGTTSVVARLSGQGQPEQLLLALLRAAAIALGLAALILLLAPPFFGPAAALAGGGGEVSELARQYLQIRIWAAPASLLNYCLVGWFIGTQKSRQAMLLLILINLINAGLDYLFIVQWQQHIVGAARAAVLAEYGGLIAGLLLFAHTGLWRQWSTRLRKELCQLEGYRELFGLNADLFVRTLSLLFVFLFMAAQGARLGEAHLAANTILLNLLAFTAYLMDGFAYSAESLCGRAWGADDRRSFWRNARDTALLAAATALGCSLVLLVFQPFILAAYTDLELVRHSAQAHYQWLAWLPLLAMLCYQLDGIFIGMGHTGTMRNAMLLSLLLAYLPAWWLSRPLGVTGLWVALWAFHIARALGLGLPLWRLYRRDSNLASG